MKAAMQHTYGSPNVLELTEDVACPAIEEQDVLVQVCASQVTQGDRRLRAGDFPGMTFLPGRLALGPLRPYNRVPGTDFAGQVVAVGKAVTQFAVGDDVFGSVLHGAYAEFLALPQDGTVAAMPKGLTYEEAAAIPYGAVTALTFLRDIANLQRGERLLVLGASGGVGRYAVQLGKHIGAQVVGVCSKRNVDLVRSLGADQVIDYESESFRDNGERYNVVLDTIGVTHFAAARGSLTKEGRYASLIVNARLLMAVLTTSIIGGQRALQGVAMGSRSDMEEVRLLVDNGALHPVIDRRYPLERIAEAHQHLETGQPQGSVVLTHPSCAA